MSQNTASPSTMKHIHNNQFNQSPNSERSDNESINQSHNPSHNLSNVQHENQSVKHDSHSQHVRQMLLESAWSNLQNPVLQQLPQLSHISSRTSSATDYTPYHVRSPTFTSGSNTPSDPSSLLLPRPDSGTHIIDYSCFPDQASSMNQDEHHQQAHMDSSNAFYHQFNLFQQLLQQQQQQQQSPISPEAIEKFTASELAQRILAPPTWCDDSSWNSMIFQSPVTVDLLGCLFMDTERTFEANLEQWGDDFVQRARQEVVTHVHLNKPFHPAIHAVEMIKMEIAVRASKNLQNDFDLRRCQSDNVPTRGLAFSPSIPSGHMFKFEALGNNVDSTTDPLRSRNLGCQAPNSSPFIAYGVPLLPDQPLLVQQVGIVARQTSAPVPQLARSLDLSGHISMMQITRDMQNRRTDSQYLGIHAATRGIALSPNSFDSSKRRRRRSEELAESERWKCCNIGCWRFYRKSSTASIRSHQQVCLHRDPSQTQPEQKTASPQSQPLPSQPSQSPRTPLETLREDSELIIFRDE